MIKQNHPLDIDQHTVSFALGSYEQTYRVTSLMTNRPDENSRYINGVFFGACSMPRSEHLIPFLN